MASDPYKPVMLSLPGQFAPDIAVEILPQGVTVHRIYVQADGKTHDIIIGPEDPAHYSHPPHKYKNVIIGRYTNRIPVGTFEIAHPDDSSAKSSLTTVANESPTVSLHGGPRGFDAEAFETLTGPEQLTLFSAAEKALLSKDDGSSYALFKHISPDGDQGFPGELLIEVLVGVAPPSDTSKVASPKDEVHLGSTAIVYRAKVTSRDGEKVTTPINITQHWGFNLDASLRATEYPTVKNHLLSIASDDILELGPGFIATGKLTPVKGTPHEHNLERGPVGTRYPPKGYDDFYLFSKSQARADLAPGRIPLSSLDDASFDLLSPILDTNSTVPSCVVLSSPESGLNASFDTNQGGVQFWSCEPFEGEGAVKRIHGGTGQEDGNKLGYKGGAAAFLEFHEPHAAFLHPEIVAKSISKYDTLLGSGELYHNFVKVDIRFKSPDAGSA